MTTTPAQANACSPESGDVLRGRSIATTPLRRVGALLAVAILAVASFCGVDRPAGAIDDLGPDAAFVTAAYEDFLGTTPTSAQLASATAASLAASPARSVLVGTLSRSTAWLHATVNHLYVDTLGRTGEPDGLAFWTRTLADGTYTVAQVAASFYSSKEYFTGFGESDVRTWVIDLYRKILDRDPVADPGGVAYWVGQAALKGRTWVAYQIYQSSESRHTRVAGLYRILLGRAPDRGGWDYWADVVGKKGDLALAANLAASSEYYWRSTDRFGPAQLAAPSTVTVSRTWAKNLGANRMVVRASPSPATLGGGVPAVIVGDQGGYVNALGLSDGAKVWSAATGGRAADSTASVTGTGTSSKIYVGVGTSATPTVGGYLALDGNGARRWFVQPKARPSSTTNIGVMSSMTIGNFQGTNDVVGGSMGQLAYAMNAQGGVLSGFPWFEADSNFATPATLDVDGNGTDEIVMGGDSTKGVAFGRQYSNGGHLRILSGRGHAGSSNPGNGLRCQYDTTQVVQSSPAVGRFLAGGAVGIVAGTGTYWAGASDTNKVIAIDKSCRLKWKADLGANTSAAPALADLFGDGRLMVVAGTRSTSKSGSVTALDGTNGEKIWTTKIPGGVYGGIATADLRGIGRQDVVVATATGVYVLDGRTGVEIGRFGQGIGLQNTVLVTTDPDGKAGITIAGYNGQREGIVAHYQLDGNLSSVVGGRGGWPMFHHDRHLSGNADFRG